ncbi:MAG: hypothetical protein Q7R78_03135 [bacterium]|nr:hypothetical protein [bacterium]
MTTIKEINLKGIIGLSLIISLLFVFLYPVLEPITANAIDSQFTVKQTVTSEIAFATSPSNVTMSPSIPGLTGGTATGQATFSVITNNATGYNVTLVSSSTDGAMMGETQGGKINAYTPSSVGVPDYTFSVGANTGEFGYTVLQATEADAGPLFKSDGASACNTGSTNDGTHCWLNATSSAVTIVNRSSETAIAGELTTLNFKVQITSNPSPIIPTDTYTATTTITAVTNP